MGKVAEDLPRFYVEMSGGKFEYYIFVVVII